VAEGRTDYPVGWWVLRRHAAYGICNLLFQAPNNYVNISGRQFATGAGEQIDQVLGDWTGCLQFESEITGVIMENTEAATSMLQQLKALAVQLHIDIRYGLFLPELPAPFPYRYVKD